MGKNDTAELSDKLETMQHNLNRFLDTGAIEVYDYVRENYDRHLQALWLAGERGDVFRTYINAGKELNKRREQWETK